MIDQLAAAENLWKQGDRDGAWLALEGLVPVDRVKPQVIDLRLRAWTSSSWRAVLGLLARGGAAKLAV